VDSIFILVVAPCLNAGLNATMDFWNVKKLKGPPNLTIQYDNDERVKVKLNSSLQTLHKSLRCGNDALSDADVIKSFQLEHALLKTIILQNIRHRTEKFFRVLKKVEKTCDRWQEHDLERVLNDILQLMPNISSQERILRIPSRQMFEYLLCRILGAFHLLLALDGYCLESARYIMNKISSGHFFATAMVFLATVARIRVQALDFAGQLAKLYDKIFSLVSDIKSSAVEWLPNEILLPNTLSPIIKQHCSVKNKYKLQHHEKEKVKESKEVNGILSLFKSDMDEDNEIKYPNQITENLLENEIDKEESDTMVSLLGGVFLEEDIGESCFVTDLKKEVKHIKISTKNKRKKSVFNEENNNECGNSFLVPEKNVNGNKKKAEKLNKKVDKKSQMCKKKAYSKSVIVTDKFVKSYKKVKKCLKNLNTFEDFSRFLIAEKKRRSEKCPSRVSSSLKKQDWLDLTKLLRNRIKKYHKLKKDSAGNLKIDINELLRKSKNKVKFWLLFPKEKGNKPHNWQFIVKEVKNKNK
ncbi:unnamed protein product, partial [Meganyctiphanes norvegica]